MAYTLEHPYGGRHGSSYNSLNAARAAALRIIKAHYPSEGKHFAELRVLKGGKEIGTVGISWKIRGRKLSFYHKDDREYFAPYFKDHYSPVSDDRLYTLNADGSVAERYNDVRVTNQGIGWTRIPYGRKTVKRASTPKPKTKMSDRVGVYALKKDGMLHRVK